MSVKASIIIYTTGYCSFCQRAKVLLAKKRAPYTEIDVEGRPDLRSWLVSASGQRTVPQIFVNGQSLGGYSDIAALDNKGRLDELLSAPPPADMAALPG